MIFEERSQADARAIDELRGEHRVEDAFRPKTAEVVEQPEVEVAAVHHQVFLGEAGPEAVELERSEGIDQEDLIVDEELQEADPRAIMKHVIRFRIERHLVDLVQSSEEGRKLTRLVDEGEDGRT